VFVKFGMKKTIFLTFLLFAFALNSLHAQSKLGAANKKQKTFVGTDGLIDTLRNTGFTKVILSGKTKYTDYKIFSHKRDTIFIDTTLTLKKEYKFNYLRTGIKNIKK
jgi:hypothetical protein